MDEIANETLLQLLNEMRDDALIKSADDIHIGDIIFYEMDRSDGIIPKDGYETRNKYVVVSGAKSNQKEICAVLVNSDKDYSDDPRWQAEQYCIKQENYPSILVKDSWVDCSDPKELLVRKLKSKKAFRCCNLNSMDLLNIMKHLKENGFVDEHIRKVYGIKNFKIE